VVVAPPAEESLSTPDDAPSAPRQARYNENEQGRVKHKSPARPNTGQPEDENRGRQQKPHRHDYRKELPTVHRFAAEALSLGIVLTKAEVDEGGVELSLRHLIFEGGRGSSGVRGGTTTPRTERPSWFRKRM
jgi:hypothetical protein